MTWTAPEPQQGMIAIVEDDPAVLGSLTFALELEGYGVAAFSCASDALLGIDSAQVDCLVIDFALPDFDGLALLRSLRRRGVTAPAVIVASSPPARCRREAAEAGAPLVEKPILGEVLSERIRLMIGESGGRPL